MIVQALALKDFSLAGFAVDFLKFAITVFVLSTSLNRCFWTLSLGITSLCPQLEDLIKPMFFWLFLNVVVNVAFTSLYPQLEDRFKPMFFWFFLNVVVNIFFINNAPFKSPRKKAMISFKFMLGNLLILAANGSY